MSKRKQTGFTVTELIITMALIAIITTLAAPAIGDFFDRRRLVAGVEAVRDELRSARVLALSSASNLRVVSAGGVSVNFDRVADNDWRIGVSVNTGCDPRETDLTEDDACYIIVDDGDSVMDGVDANLDGTLDSAEEDDGDRVLKVLSSDNYRGANMPNAVAFNPGATTEVTFDPVRGIPVGRRTGTLTFRSDKGREARVAISPIGSVTVCSPAGTAKVLDYRAC